MRIVNLLWTRHGTDDILVRICGRGARGKSVSTLNPMGAWCSNASTEPTKMRQRQREAQGRYGKTEFGGWGQLC